MLDAFFLHGAMPVEAKQGVYNPVYVGLSYIVAAFASYLALVLARRLADSKNTKRRHIILWGGALALGTGIWSMHFIGMLAFNLDMPMDYDPWLTILSLLVAIASAYGVLTIVSHERLKFKQIIGGTILLGIGISAMHYIGMAAMVMDADMRYRADIFLLSIAIAMTASGAALWICFHMARHHGKYRYYLKACASLIMAAAICGMHYTGMAAAVFIPHMEMEHKEAGISSNGIALGVVIIGIILGLALPVAINRSIEDDKDDSTSTFPTRLLSLTIFGTFGVLIWICGYGFYNNYGIAENGFSADEALKISNSLDWISFVAAFVSIVLMGAWYFALRSIRLWRSELRSNKTILRTILDNMPLALFAKDAANDYRWLLLNRMAEDMFCLKNENVIGHPDSKFFPKEEADFFRRTDIEVMAAGKLVDIEAEPVTTPKGTFTSHTIKVPIYDANGAPHILLGMCEDVTEKFKAKEELRQAKERAEKADQAKSEFLANMSHELRTPLNSILGMTRLLQESGVTDDQRSLTETVLISSVSLLEIVNDILDLSKIEAGALQLEYIGIDLSYLVHSVIDRLDPLAREKKLQPIAYEDSKPPYVLGDPIRLTRILTNLISNAIKYTDQGGVRIKTSHRVQNDTHILYRCEIIDTGIGIPAEKHAAIFEKFTQADTSTTRRYGGTGLGLAITKQLVELMEGSIGLTSIDGEGSTFWLEIAFPITDQLHREKSGQRKSVKYSDIKASATRILVAEDHPMNQIFISKLLQRFGVGYFEVVANGVKAIELYQSGKWDMILMDCHMPEKNGYDTTIAIRELEKTTGSHIPIIAMTANAMIGDREKCLRCGMDDYISKPIAMDELADIMGQWIKIDEFDKAEVRPNEAPEAAIDLTQMRTITNGDAELERELMGAFLQQSEENLRIMSANIIDGVSPEWIEAAHMLKGSSGSIGAYKLSALCASAQEMDSATASERSALLMQIKAVYDRIKSVLREQGLSD